VSGQVGAAVQDFASVADQVSIAAPPDATVLGLALSLTTGAGVATVTDTDWVAVPPAPVHCRVYSEVLVSGPICRDPVIGCGPLQAPAAVHELAPVAFQFNCVDSPLVTVVEAAPMVTSGGTEDCADAAEIAVPESAASTARIFRLSTRVLKRSLLEQQ